MIIDWHANLSLDSHFAEEEAEFASRVGSSRSAPPDLFERDVAGLAEKFVVVGMRFPILKMDVPNAFVAEFVARHKNCARGFACVQPFEEDAPKTLTHAIRGLGLHGLKISPVYGGFDPWGREAGELYKVCDALGVPLLWHQSAAYASGAWLEMANPILLDRICREFPRLKMIVAHLGQPWMAETVMLLRKHPHIYSDLSARFHRKYQLYQGLMLAHEYGVTKQLLFGSDYPVRTTAAALAEFRSLNDWEDGVRLPRFPEEAIEDIINNRPLNLIWADA
jgi:predicted TIM-barrel fold metal-dependent hydrolase